MQARVIGWSARNENSSAYTPARPSARVQYRLFSVARGGGFDPCRRRWRQDETERPSVQALDRPAGNTKLSVTR